MGHVQETRYQRCGMGWIFCGRNTQNIVHLFIVRGDGRDEYVFKADGSYSHKEKQAGEHFGVLLGDKNRETIRFSFADKKMI